MRGSTPGDIVLFALAVTFVPALVLLAIEVVVELVTRRDAVVLHYVFLGFLAAVFGVQALKRSGVDSTVVLIVGAVAIGVALAVAAWRVPLVRYVPDDPRPARRSSSSAPSSSTRRSRSSSFRATVKASAATVESTTPVVYLLFDEFPVIDLLKANGEIDAKRFPNFARLARTSTWFRNTTTLSASTTVAVPVILTGNPPVRGALPVAQNYPHNLFTLLASRYRMKVTESQTRLCPSQICHAQGAEHRVASDVALLGRAHRLPAPRRAAVARGAAAGDRRVVGELRHRHRRRARGRGAAEGEPAHLLHRAPAGLQPLHRVVRGAAAAARQPTLYFLHVLMPHGPWLYTQNGQRARGDEPAVAGAHARALVERRPRDAGVAAAPAAGRLHRQAARPPHRPPARGRPLEQGARRRRPRPRHQLPRRRPAPRSHDRRTSPTSRSSRSS